MRLHRTSSLPIRSRQEWLALAERYFDAETSLEEEAQLRRFAVSPAAAADPAFDELRAVMAYSSHASLSPLRAAPMHRQQASPRALWPTIGRIAVAAMLVIGAGFGIWCYQQRALAPAETLQAYVYGETLTSPDAVMMQMRAVMRDVCDESDAPSVETQLRSVLNNL